MKAQAQRKAGWAWVRLGPAQSMSTPTVHPPFGYGESLKKCELLKYWRMQKIACLNKLYTPGPRQMDTLTSNLVEYIHEISLGLQPRHY